MAIEGTKGIEIEGRRVFVPADDAELETLIAAGLEAQQRLEEARADLEQTKELLVAIAEKRRNGMKSVQLTMPSERASALVTWATETKVHDHFAEELERDLPAAIFNALFSKRVVYSPARGFSNFMRRPQHPDVEKLKLRVAKAVEFRPKRPSVVIESRAGTLADPDR